MFYEQVNCKKVQGQRGIHSAWLAKAEENIKYHYCWCPPKLHFYWNYLLVLIKNKCFFVSMQSGIGTENLSVTDHNPTPNSCWISHKISHLHLRSNGMSIHMTTDKASQATSQNRGLDRTWGNSIETRRGSRGIFSCRQGLYSTCCLCKGFEIIPGLCIPHSSQILNSYKYRKIKYKLTWCWDPKPNT